MKLLILVLIFPLFGCAEERAKLMKTVIDTCPKGAEASMKVKISAVYWSATTSCAWIIKND